jgi:hypothetical protein
MPKRSWRNRIRLDFPAPMLPATAMNLVFTAAAPLATRVECRDRAATIAQIVRPRRGLPFRRQIVYKDGSFRTEGTHVKASTKNRAKGNRKKAALAKKYAKRRLRASSGQQKF